MIWTILALITWVILGGFIAYYGDVQGSRWGKKRISKFGLRPKHTAMLLTSLTGGFIALMSIVTLMLISNPIRQVILRGEKAIEDTKYLNLQLEHKAAKYNEDIRASTTKYAQLETQRKNLDAQLTAVNFQLIAIKSQYQQALRQNTRIVESNEKLISAKQLLSDNVRTLKLARNKLVASKLDLESTNKTLGDQNYTYTRDNTKLSAANKELIDLNRQIRDAGVQLTKANAELNKANTVLERSNKVQLDANRQQLADEARLKNEIEDLQNTQDQLYRKQNDLYTQLAVSGRDMQQTFLALRQRPLSVRAGEMLGKRVISPHQRPEAIRKELVSLLEDASTAALVHGAAKGENGRAVRIVNKHIITLTGEHDADEQASLDALVETLYGSDQPVVVVVNAINNSVEGEDVLVELSPRAVTPLFAKGDVIARGKVDARQQTDKILNSIVAFLQNDVRNSAMKAGAVPAIDPETGKPNYGLMSPSDLLMLTDRIRRRGGEVEITAVAKESLTSADPIQIEFKLKRL